MYNSAMTTPTVRLAAARALGTTTRGYATSPWASQQPPKGKRKIVLVGAGFVGSYIAKALVADPRNQVVLASRNPEPLYTKLRSLGSSILPPTSLDITKPTTLNPAFKGADCIVSLVGILTGTPEEFKRIQEQGGENVARAAKEEGVKRVVVVSALGIEAGGTPYAETKLAMERSFKAHHPTSTIIRPSLVFGPGDSFFSRFATLANYLPLLPLFGGGTSRFQPIYVGDLAKAVEVATRDETCEGGKDLMKEIEGKTIQGGGPDVFTFKQLMQLTLRYTGLEGRRLLLPIPFWAGLIQAWFLEKLPLPDVLKLTRDQVRQLKNDNKESDTLPQGTQLNVASLLKRFPAAAFGTEPPAGLKSVYDILPVYIRPRGQEEEAPVVSGKRRHGRDYVGGARGEAQVRKMTEQSGVKKL